MGVIRITKHEAPYVMLDKTALYDKRLSFRAKGLHAYLMSKPDDWTIHIEDLVKKSPSDGREAVAKGLKDLETWGYIRRRRTRDARGRMSGWDTVVYETPWLAVMADEDAQLTGDAPKTGLPTSAKPMSVDAPETIDISESTPKTYLPTSAKPMSVAPKTDSPKSANPQLLMNVNTQRNETTSSTDLARDTAQSGEDTPAPRVKKLPKSQEPGELHPTVIKAVESLVVQKFHCLAQPTKQNENFWDSQIALVEEAGIISFVRCLKEVDAYWSGNPNKLALKPDGLRRQMHRGIEIALEKAQRNLKGIPHHG